MVVLCSTSLSRTGQGVLSLPQILTIGPTTVHLVLLYRNRQTGRHLQNSGPLVSQLPSPHPPFFICSKEGKAGTTWGRWQTGIPPSLQAQPLLKHSPDPNTLHAPCHQQHPSASATSGAAALVLCSEYELTPCVCFST